MNWVDFLITLLLALLCFPAAGMTYFVAIIAVPGNKPTPRWNLLFLAAWLFVAAGIVGIMMAFVWFGPWEAAPRGAVAPAPAASSGSPLKELALGILLGIAGLIGLSLVFGFVSELREKWREARGRGSQR